MKLETCNLKHFFRKYSKFLVLSFMIYVSCFMFHVSFIHAQEINLSVAPPLIKTIIKPGKTILIGYKLQNLGDPVIVTTRVAGLIPIGNNGGLRIENGPTDPILFNLDNAELKLNQPFLMKSAQQQQLLVRIKVPDQTPEGDYYYTLLNETKPSQSDSELSTSTKATIGSNILLTVTKSGKTDINGKIAFFDVVPRFKLPFFGNVFDSSDKIPVRLFIVNVGHNVITPEGTINLIGNFGEKATFNIIPKNILINSQRIMEASTSGQMTDQADSSLLLSGFFLGHYKLATTINFGPGTQTLFGQASFIAFHIKLVIVLTFVLFIVFILLKQYKKQTLP